MKLEYVIVLIILHIICIETRTAWVYSLNQNTTKDINITESEQPPLNLSRSDVKTFVKVLSLLRKQLEHEVREQYEKKDWQRTLLKCTELDTEKEDEVGVILPIPDPLEDLTLVSLLYDDTANWSKCTRSCKSQRLRKCRANGLCSMDYLVEEAFCFFPESKCVKKVKTLIKQLNKYKATKNEEAKQDDYDEYHNGDYNDIQNHKDQDQNYDDEYQHNHYDDDYEHNHEDYDHNNSDHHYEDEDHNYDDYNSGPDDYNSNSFWENDDYSYGDPETNYDCSDCSDDDYGLIESGEDESDDVDSDSGDDGDDQTCGRSYAGVPKRAFRIIGGHRAVKGAWPWQVGIVDRYQSNFCGGTIIGARWILTAAHCVKYGIRIKIAEHDVSRYDGEVEIKVRKSFIHPHFDSESYDCDIALLKLRKSVFKVGKPSVKKACLPKPSSKLPKKKSCIVLGWGSEKESNIYGSDVLKYAKVPIVSDRKCQHAYPDFHITKHMFCAGFLRGGPDTCSGDSGGPLLCQDDAKQWVLQGVTSFGEGCGQRGRFGVYTKVKNFLHWINRTMSHN